MKNVTCIDCKNLCMEGASFDQPYPAVWCSAGEFDGIGDDSAIYSPLDCELYEQKPGIGAEAEEMKS